jgi:uncharacterized membrane protein (DUF2068 family)
MQTQAADEPSAPTHATAGDGQGSTQSLAKDRSKGLLLIGLFKLSKSIFFFLMGIGAFHLMHRDLQAEALRLEHALHFDPEGRIAPLLLSKLSLIDVHRLRQIGFFTFAYSALALTEGVGLVLEKVWAEYLTLGLTILFIPWELWEIYQRPTWFRGSLLAINLLVLGYLLWLLERKRQRKGSGLRD